MRFSIVTPSWRSSRWLKLCVASVADQGVEVEHIVQDGGSDDGTQSWLPGDRRVRAFVEPDQGMYDAINRGLGRATGDLLAYLNCDEQYLPGALAAVADYFAAHASVDVVFADAVVVDGAGRYLCHRQALRPLRWHTRVSGTLAILSCATFFRRRIIDDGKLLFDARYHAIADAHWLLDLLERRVSMGVLRRFTSACTTTGHNLSVAPAGEQERRAYIASAPWWLRALRPGIIAHHRLRKLVAGHYWTAPFDYALYTTASPDRRALVHVDRPVARWQSQRSWSP